MDRGALNASEFLEICRAVSFFCWSAKITCAQAAGDYVGQVFARCGKFLVVIALVLTTGLHWAALQTVAWTTMLAGNLCGESFTTAVSQTFDGRHLCPLCRAILAAKKSEKKSEAVATTLKMEYPPMTGRIILISPSPVSALSLARLSAESSFLKPPLPPPRGFFV